MISEALIVEDAGISGASRHERPQFLELMARIDEWDVLLCWDFSRLARNEEDLGWVRNRLRAAKKNAYAVNTGRSIHDLGSRVEGVIAAEYLEKLKVDTHRGLRGRAERCLFPGGLPYGYRTEEIPTGRVDPHGRSIPAGYRLLINPPQSEVVQQIFELYARGEGLRTIAQRLNAERAPSPRCNGWSSSALQAMLQNPIYQGTYIWNRSEWIKEHETGKRRRFERPESDWLRREMPELAIVSPALWTRVEALRLERARGYPRRKDGRLTGRARASHTVTSRYLLSGLLQCAECGGAFFALRKESSYGCGWHRDRGPTVCGNGIQVPRAELEARVLGAIREQILVPDHAMYVVQRALEQARERAGHDGVLERARLSEVDLQIANLVALAANLGSVDEVADRIRTLKMERAVLRTRLAYTAIPEAVDLKGALETALRELEVSFCSSPDRARAALRRLLPRRRLSVGPDPERGFLVRGLLRLELRMPSEPSSEGVRYGGSGGALRTIADSSDHALAA
jgi:DNA invertase Pin-like site-specific DNA recombinase